MTIALLYKLLAIVLVVFLGWVVGKLRWLGDEKAEPARVLSNAAFYLFAPALLFRTTSRVDLPHLPWGMLAAFFIPVLITMFGVYGWQRTVRVKNGLPVAAPAVSRRGFRKTQTEKPRRHSRHEVVIFESGAL